ncbi:MAG: GNAT family protein [Bacteroidota bacterium]
MINLKPFEIEDWKYLSKWIKTEEELVQFAGPIFNFPINKVQVQNYLSAEQRIVFKIIHEQYSPIGIAEIYVENERLAKLARILIGDNSMRGKGIGTKLIQQLVTYVFEKLNKQRIILNVFSWNNSAIRCYEKVGFIKTNKAPTKITVGEKRWEVSRWKGLNNST